MKISPIVNPTQGNTTPGAVRQSITMNTGVTPKMQSMPDLRPGFTDLRSQQAADLAASKAPKQHAIEAYKLVAKQFEGVGSPPSTQIVPEALQSPLKVLGEGSIAEEQPKTEVKGQELSPQQVVLARKEQAFREAQQQLKVDKEAFEREKANYVSKETLSSDTLKALSEAGISYDKLVELQLNHTPPSETQALQAKIEALEAKLSALDGSLKERDNQTYNNAVNVIRNDVKLLVESDPAYETIKAEEESEAVVEFIKEKFKLTGEIVSVETAATKIEDYLAVQALKKLEQLEQLSKIKAKREAAQAAQTEASKAPAAKQAKPIPPTLSNRQGVGRPLTPVERAILAYKGELK